MNITNGEWYTIKDVDILDSPALVIYTERVKENIHLLISMIDDIKRLRPHVKTNKSIEAVCLMLDAGISKFKCATIAEAEMLAIPNVPDVLLAYQPAGPKIDRLISLIKKYSSTKFSCLVDNTLSAEMLAGKALQNDVTIPVYIDLNVGMNRTGIHPGNEAIELYKHCATLKGIIPFGLHAYDGHIHTIDFQQRFIECNDAYKAVEQMQQQLLQQGFDKVIIVAGGSPTFPIHAERKDIECSPGTFIYWDKGYETLYAEQKFLPAALVITRVVSFPEKNKLCLDLGHKSIAAEKDLDHRVNFLNARDIKFISQSEEHLVVEVNEDHTYKIGDVLYGLPYHICPTVALYERAITVTANRISGEWKTIARDRKINV